MKKNKKKYFYIYLRENAEKFEGNKIYKLGCTHNLFNRDAVYKTGELNRKKFIKIIKFTSINDYIKEENEIEKIYKERYVFYNINNLDGGSEFYRALINSEISYFTQFYPEFQKYNPIILTDEKDINDEIFNCRINPDLEEDDNFTKMLNSKLNYIHKFTNMPKFNDTKVYKYIPEIYNHDLFLINKNHFNTLNNKTLNNEKSNDEKLNDKIINDENLNYKKSNDEKLNDKNLNYKKSNDEKLNDKNLNYKKSNDENLNNIIINDEKINDDLNTNFELLKIIDNKNLNDKNLNYKNLNNKIINDKKINYENLNDKKLNYEKLNDKKSNDDLNINFELLKIIDDKNLKQINKNIKYELVDDNKINKHKVKLKI